MNLIIKTLPKNPEFQSRPDRANTVEYGRYLINAAGCKSCHTPFANGKYLEEMTLAGNREFELPGGILKSANITFHEETGIGTWSKETFIERFKMYENFDVENSTVQPDAFNTVMPWTLYAGMHEEDLEAIYEYLKSIEPIENKVVVFQNSN